MQDSLRRFLSGSIRSLQSMQGTSKTSLWVMLVLLCLFANPSGWSQVATGSINGIVTDQQGAVIAGAKVSVRNVDTQIVSAGTTNSDGSYLVQSLNVGS